MAQRCGPPFDFDLNEPPPEDDDVANHASPAREPEPMREPSPRVLLPPSPENTLPASPQLDSLPPPPAPPAPESSPRDPLPAPVPEPSPRDPLPAPVPESSAHDTLTAPVPESSAHDPLPSPVLDLEAPLSSLDDDYDEEHDYDEADQPPPPPLPPHGLVPVAAAPARSSSSLDTPGAPPFRPDRHGEGTSSQEPFAGDAAAARLSSPENSAPRGPSSGTASSHRSRRRPYSHDPRDDDAISKQRLFDNYDEDAGSSRSGSRRSELASLPHYEQGGGRHATAAHGQPGAPPRNRRRRTQRPPQQGYEYTGSIPKQQGRGWEQPQGLRGGGQERPQAQQVHGPHGPEATTKVGYSSNYPLLLSGSYDDGRQVPEQEPINGNGRYHHQRREAPPPSSRPRGREDPYYGRRSQVQGPPNVGGYQQKEGQSLRPSSGAHGRDGSSAGRPRPPEQPVNSGGAYQQRKAPRGGDRFPDHRPYHPYAQDGGGVFDRTNGGQQGRREHPPNYEHRRRDNTQQRAAGGPARGRQYYSGD